MCQSTDACFVKHVPACHLFRHLSVVRAKGARSMYDSVLARAEVPARVPLVIRQAPSGQLATVADTSCVVSSQPAAGASTILPQACTARKSDEVETSDC
jgi:hypothetical protein